jgi:hypothetical protein
MSRQISGVPVFFGVDTDQNNDQAMSMKFEDISKACRMNGKVKMMNAKTRFSYIWYLKCKKSASSSDLKGKNWNEVTGQINVNDRVANTALLLGAPTNFVGGVEQIDKFSEHFQFKHTARYFFTLTYCGRIAPLGPDGCSKVSLCDDEVEPCPSLPCDLRLKEMGLGECWIYLPNGKHVIMDTIAGTCTQPVDTKKIEVDLKKVDSVARV